MRSTGVTFRQNLYRSITVTGTEEQEEKTLVSHAGKIGLRAHRAAGGFECGARKTKAVKKGTRG
jgi:hypothetical protein